MPTICDASLGSVDSIATEGLLEEEIIRMPSDLTKHPATFVGYKDLAQLEMHLREAEAQEAIDQVRDVVQMLCATWDEKAVHIRGYIMNTCSKSIIDKLESKRDLYINRYNHARKVILSLRMLRVNGSSNEYLPLTIKDTIQKLSKP
jgi:hypothetical protein